MRIRLFAVSAVAALVAGLLAQAPALAAPSHARPVVPRTGLPAGVMPTRAQALRATSPFRNTSGPGTCTASPTNTCLLTYRGGPVLSHASVVSLLWSDPTTVGYPYQPEVLGTVAPNATTFWRGVLNSAYLSWLTEYNTPVSGGTGQTIGYGQFQHGPDNFAQPATGTVDDSAIETALASALTSGTVAAPSIDPATGFVNTIYAFYFPAGTTITAFGGSSGVQFCAYHGTITVNLSGTAHNVPYMVLPDMSSSTMASGCSSPDAVPTAWHALLYSSSHELAEAITDPWVGLPGAGVGILGWYDDYNGEIGDICANVVDTVLATDGVTYPVQDEWSNQAAYCIAQKTATSPGAPQSPKTQSAAGGKVTVSWAAPATDGGSAITAYRVFRSSTSGMLGTQLGSDLPVTQLAFTDSTLAAGTNGYYTVEAVNVYGATASNQVSGFADATAPHPSFTSPVALFQATKSILVKVTATDADSPQGIRYSVRYRSASWNGSFPSTWSGLAGNTLTTSFTVTGYPGREYCFEVMAKDAVGNASTWSSQRCTVVPLDDRSLAVLSGSWSRLTGTAFYLGTVTRSTTLGSRLTLKGAHTARLALVVTTCPTCGYVGVYVNGVLWRTVSTYATTTHYRVVIPLTAFALGFDTITLREASSAKPVYVDGLGVSET